VLTASRKRYVKRDEGLAGLAGERDTLAEELSHPSFTKAPSSVQQLPLIIQQMGVIERAKFEARWPDSLAVESATQTLFERLMIVRELNKRHIQRRALIDLQKYLKEQGLQHNFQSTILPLLLETPITQVNSQTLSLTKVGAQNDFRKYYLKAHELMLMLESASEAENAGPQHLRNVEIIRVRGFSQSLV
jgi:hypothetical protein